MSDYEWYIKLSPQAAINFLLHEYQRADVYLNLWSVEHETLTKSQTLKSVSFLFLHSFMPAAAAASSF